MFNSKIIPLSLICISFLQASDIELSQISVEATTIKEVSQNAQVSADLAQALSASVPSIDMNRRSGIANDIYIRGQKRDNISIDIDGTKIQGACVNRMDPPISHILANQIDEIEVIEGPYDVENFGTMSGGIKIKTKKPTKDFYSEINFGYGSFNYKKIGATFNGGTDFIRLLVSASYENSEQYKDGNGDTISEQIDNYAKSNPSASGTKLKNIYHNMDAYTKKSIMSKIFIDIAKNQELRLSYTANRSDNILYGNSKMDALYDDSNIYSIEYNINHINNIYKNINLKYYYSDVNHPMSTTFRIASNNPMMDNTNHLTTTMQGFKLKNIFDLNTYEVLIGLDFSKREWDGKYYNTSTKSALMYGDSKSINNAKTINNAIFTKIKKSFGALSLKFGARFDSTDIKYDGTEQSRDYTSFNLNIFSSIQLNKENKIFMGIGQASRVPDARELYFTGTQANIIGTPNLNQTTNKEIDLGYEASYENFNFKIKAFYSKLNDYIYIKKNVGTNAFENIDAKVYGTELTSSYFLSDDITSDFTLSYKKGKKDEAISGQTDKDLADIAPLRANVSLNYEYKNKSIASIEVVASEKWRDFDENNGEQEISSWAVLNLKLKHHFNKHLDISIGVNNLFDKTYAISNTYADLTLITAGGTSDVLLMNEAGRYIYTNVTFKY